MAQPWLSNSLLLSEGPLPARDLFPDDAWTAKLAVAPVRGRARTSRAPAFRCLRSRGARRQGTVYGNRWEQQMTNAVALEVGPSGAYTPPFASGPPSNPRCFLAIRAGGVSLGRVVFELRADVAPLAAENFRALCAFRVYKGAILHRIFPDFVVQVRARIRLAPPRVFLR